MTEHDLKELKNLGAELGAVKAENEKLREIAEDSGRELQAWIASFPRASHHQAKALIARISAALSRQTEPAEPAPAQDGREFDSRCLDPYLRQYCHNDGSPGFVFGYEAKGTEELVDRLRAALSAVTAERDRLEQALGDKALCAAYAERQKLRAEIEAARLLLSECDKVIKEDGGVYIELRAYLRGDLPASEVIALLGTDAALAAKEG